MKKIMTLLPVLILTLFAAAQTKRSGYTPFVQFGIKGGINLSDVKSAMYPKHEARLGYHAGVLGHIHMSTHFAIQPEVLFSSQGFKRNVSSNYDQEVTLNYINIPVLFQYMQRGVRLETGPQVGFLVKAKEEFSGGLTNDLENSLKKTDFAWVFGLSYLSPVGLGLHGRYNLGISNINEKITATGVTDTEINNRVWQFGIFYQFSR